MVTEIIAVSCGVAQCQETLRTGHGHRRRPRHPGRNRRRTAALAVAKLPEGLVDKEQPGLVILGKQAIDDDANQTGQMLAALATCRRPPSPARWKWLATRPASPVKSTAAWKPCREPAGRHHHRPAPERAALRHAAQHHEGQEKPLDTVKPADLGVDVAPRIKTLKVSEPPKRSAGIKVPDVATLVDKLKNEAKVI